MMSPVLILLPATAQFDHHLTIGDVIGGEGLAEV